MTKSIRRVENGEDFIALVNTITSSSNVEEEIGELERSIYNISDDDLRKQFTL